MSKGEPIKPSTTHFFFCSQSFNSSKIWLSQLMHGNGEEYGSQKFKLKKSSDFGRKKIMTCGASKCLGMHAQAITHPLVPFSPPILLHVGFLHAVEVSCVIIHVFAHFPHVCMPTNLFWYCSVSGKGRFTFFLHFHGFFNGWESFSPC